MPELSDLTIYLEALERHVLGGVLKKICLASICRRRWERTPA